MRTINIYNFNELPPESRVHAISNVREKIYDPDEAYRWSIDDCALLEPEHQEMVELFGGDYYDRNLTPDGKYGQFMFANTRKIEWNYTNMKARIANGLHITNDKFFKLWLGIPERFHDLVSYEVVDKPEGGTRLELVHRLLSDNPISETLNGIFVTARDKFRAHVAVIHSRILDNMNNYYSDEEMVFKISEGNWEFMEDGSIYK